MVVHHKDSNRKNNAPSNNITNCWSCHEKTKSRARGLKVANKKPKKKCKEGLTEATVKGGGKELAKKILQLVKKGKIKYGDKLTFVGDRAAAQGLGDEVKRSLYFIAMGNTGGSLGMRLGKSKPKNPAPENFDPSKMEDSIEFIRTAKTWSHNYGPNGQYGFGKIRVKNASGARPNAAYLNYIGEITY